MSPRRNQRRRDGREVDEASARGGVEMEYGGEHDDAWNVRQVTPSGAAKAYRCPGCDHEIRAGVAHVVAWPADGRGDATDRRHWHTACWRARYRRQPTRKYMR